MEFTYTKGPNRGEVVKHWSGGITEKYRLRNGALQYLDEDTGIWRGLQPWTPAFVQEILRNEIARLWPPTKAKVEPFGEFKWLPAGEGCVRTLTPDVYYSRVRRHPEGLEWQQNPRYKDRAWHVNGVVEFGPWPDGAKAALDHFWPLAPAKSETPKEAIAWQFKATPEEVDVARCLREAYDVGAREVTIYKDGEADETYLHLSVQPEVERFLGSIRGDSLHVTVGIQDWVTYGRPLLSAARAWEAEQKAKSETKIVVKVKGVR